MKNKSKDIVYVFASNLSLSCTEFSVGHFHIDQVECLKTNIVQTWIYVVRILYFFFSNKCMALFGSGKEKNRLLRVATAWVELLFQCFFCMRLLKERKPFDSRSSSELRYGTATHSIECDPFISPNPLMVISSMNSKFVPFDDTVFC